MESVALEGSIASRWRSRPFIPGIQTSRIRHAVLSMHSDEKMLRLKKRQGWQNQTPAVNLARTLVRTHRHRLRTPPTSRSCDWGVQAAFRNIALLAIILWYRFSLVEVVKKGRRLLPPSWGRNEKGPSIDSACYWVTFHDGRMRRLRKGVYRTLVSVPRRCFRSQSGRGK